MSISTTYLKIIEIGKMDEISIITNFWKERNFNGTSFINRAGNNQKDNEIFITLRYRLKWSYCSIQQFFWL